MAVSYHQNAGQNHSLLVANKSFEILAEFKYLVTTVTNQNCIYKEMKSCGEYLLPFHSEAFVFCPLSRN
jgi:hypothetical protein